MAKSPFSFARTSSRRRSTKNSAALQAQSPPAMMGGGGGVEKGGKKKKMGGSRLWMRFDRCGNTEVVECDRTNIMKRVSIPPRDFRILGPVFSQSSNILVRDKAMVVNLEFIKAVVTAEEVLLLDPLRQEVIPFVDQLRQQLADMGRAKVQGAGSVDFQDNELHLSTPGQWLPVPEVAEGLQRELPFEFLVLETALEFVCSYLDSSVAALEKNAYPVLDELTRNVSTKTLEHVRSLKSSLTHLLARVQKVRDEIEHLLDDNEDMAHLYLTRKWIQNHQSEPIRGVAASNSIFSAVSQLRRVNSRGNSSLLIGNRMENNDVEDLEMLLESYFLQLHGTRNKILSFREYINDTEDYVNIQLDYQRNELLQLQLILTIASFAIAVETFVAGVFAMNIPCQLYDINGIYNMLVVVLTVVSFLIFLLLIGYARWKRLLGS